MDMGVPYQGHQVDGVKILQAANDLLLFRRHEEVLRICQLGVDRSQEVVFPHLVEEVFRMRREEDEEEDGVAGGHAHSQRGVVSEESDPQLRQIQREAMREYIEAMCILAMQAYAELDRWDQVQPFLLSCYGEISQLPPRIVLMCILLFSKVRNFAEAESFSSQWLKAQNGWSVNQYCSVLELYIKQVYASQGLWREAREYVEANSVLSPERKMKYLKFLTELQRQNGDAGSEDSRRKSTTHTATGNVLLSIFQKLRSFFASRLGPTGINGLQRIQNLALISVFLYLLLFRSNTSVPTGASNASAVWGSFLGVWRSLFAPFHVMVRES